MYAFVCMHIYKCNTYMHAHVRADKRKTIRTYRIVGDNQQVATICGK